MNGEEGCLSDVNSVGKVRRWEHAGTTWRVSGSLYQKGGEILLGTPRILARYCYSHHIFNILNIILINI